MGRIIKLRRNASQHSLSLAEQMPNYQPRTFKMSDLFQLRGINWTKGRKLSQRLETPGLVEEASRGL